jgi:hypothetical protein
VNLSLLRSKKAWIYGSHDLAQNCVISVMTVGCIHLVIYQQQQQLELPKAQSQLISSFCQGRRYGLSGQAVNSIRAVALQRTNTENSKQILPEKELRGHSPNLHVSDLYIPTSDLPILLQEICGPIRGIYKSLTDT